MANTFTQIRIHFIFSTKSREPSLSPVIRERLWPFISEIGRAHGLRVVEAGGYVDHGHLLTGILATMTLARSMQITKAESSKWLHEIFPSAVGLPGRMAARRYACAKAPRWMLRATSAIRLSIIG
jgi:REP element-mobilizing transposase RayT